MSKFVEAFADKPKREDFATEEEYLAELKDWEENQKEPHPSDYDWDAEHGPAFDENLTSARPDHGYADDVEHGPGVQ